MRTELARLLRRIRFDTECDGARDFDIMVRGLFHE